MFVGAGSHAEQLGYVPEEFGDRIGIENFLFDGECVANASPSRAAAEIAFAVECDYGRFVKWRNVIGGGGMRGVVIDGVNFCLAENAKRGG